VTRARTALLMVALLVVLVAGALWPLGGKASAATGSSPFVAPTITKQPRSQTVSYGHQAWFSVAATGKPKPTVLWQLRVNHGNTWINVYPLDSPHWSTGPLTYFEQGWQWRAVFSNFAGSATTNAATITITGQPPPKSPGQSDQASPPGQTPQAGGSQNGASPAQGASGAVSPDPASLPFTGFPVEQACVLGIGLVVGGRLLLWASRRPRRRRATSAMALLGTSARPPL
jgi:hypothetical protein